MGFFNKLLGRRKPLEQMRYDVSQGNWAAAFNLATSFAQDGLSETELQEVAEIEQRAGDALARLNLEEGEGELRNGNALRAREHFQLACAQARSAALQQQAEAALAEVEKGKTVLTGEGQSTAAETHCGSSCQPLTSQRPDDLNGDAEGAIDDETRFELLLATLPPDLAERYQQTGNAFRQAWLVSHEGDPQQALKFFAEVPEAERDALYYCERGSQKGRLQDFKGALADLTRALKAEPELFVALSALVDLLVANRRLEEAEQLLRSTLAAQRFPAFCQAHLAQFAAGRGKDAEALQMAQAALDAGFADPNLVLLSAGLLEKQARYDEAEALLLKLPASAGCASGAHPLLAEFWLRRGKNLDKALESFKAVLRQEQDSPRWLLRIGQVYAARGWHNEAREQLERLSGHPGLTDVLRQELQATADQLKG